MLLIIPTIDLQEDYCVRKKNDTYERESVYFDDPAKMARLWRLQNAKALNVAGHDMGGRCKLNVLKSICDAVDIPVQLQGGVVSMAGITNALEAGVFRVIVDVNSPAMEQLLEEAVQKFGCSKIIAELRSGKLISGPGSAPDPHLPMEDIIGYARKMESAGCRRFVFSGVSFDDSATTETIQTIQRFGRSLNRAKVTVTHCVSGYSDLRRICDLSDVRVDSVIMDRVLYENAFPCQKSWSWNQKEGLDLSSFSTAELRSR